MSLYQNRVKQQEYKKRCVEPNCGKSAFGKTDKCKAHGGGKRCVEPNCDKGAIGKSDKCKAHGGGKRCPNCIDWIDSRTGSNKYDANILYGFYCKNYNIEKCVYNN